MAVTIDDYRSARSMSDFLPDNSLSAASAVSWGAVFAGAAAAAALSLILLILGTGLGLSSVSPWSQDGIGAATFGISTIVWITFTQLAASAMGGYLAGRLRTKWMDVQTDEVYFRDTAHGFLAWAVASLVTAALLTSAIGSIIGGGARATASIAGPATIGAVGMATSAGASEGAKADAGGPLSYFTDSLFRKDPSAVVSGAGTSPMGGNGAQQAPGASSPEVTRIFLNAGTGALPAEDLKYVAQLVAQRTGLTQQDAEKRVAETFANMQKKLHDAEVAAKDAVDKARKASAYGALWLFISLLIGAFIASLSATFGGRQRDA